MAHFNFNAKFRSRPMKNTPEEGAQFPGEVSPEADFRQSPSLFNHPRRSGTARSIAAARGWGETEGWGRVWGGGGRCEGEAGRGTGKAPQGAASRESAARCGGDMAGGFHLPFLLRQFPSLSRHFSDLSRHFQALSRHFLGLSRHISALLRQIPRSGLAVFRLFPSTPCPVQTPDALRCTCAAGMPASDTGSHPGRRPRRLAAGRLVRREDTAR